MNSIQRYNATLNQQPIDMVPIRVGNYNVFLTQYYEITINEYIESPKLNAEAFIEMANEFQFDSLKPCQGYIFYGCGPEMGPVWEFPQDNFPASTSGIINDTDELTQLEAPGKPSGYFAKFLEVNQKAKEAIGGAVHLGISILGPYSTMTFLRGYNPILLDIIRDPVFFERMMKKGKELSLFFGRNCMALDMPWYNVLEVFLVPGMINPKHYHAQIAPYIDEVCADLASPPLKNYLAPFMGKPDDLQSQKDGRLIYDYYFGTQESIETIRNASDYMIPGFPRLISLSGNALATWETDKIIDFLQAGLDYFIDERGEYPCIFLASIQAEDEEKANTIARKLKDINKFRASYKRHINMRKSS